MFDQPAYAFRILNIAVAYWIAEWLFKIGMESGRKYGAYIVAARRASSKGVAEVEMRVLDTGFTREDRPAY